MVQNLSKFEELVTRNVIRQIGNVMVDVQDQNGQIQRRHRSQNRTDHTTENRPQNTRGVKDAKVFVTIPPLVPATNVTSQEKGSEAPTNPEVRNEGSSQIPPPNMIVNVRRSNREKHAPPPTL